MSHDGSKKDYQIAEFRFRTNNYYCRFQLKQLNNSNVNKFPVLVFGSPRN